MAIRHLRWYIAALLFASTVVNYIDRQALSVVAPVLTKELAISQLDYGYIVQSFLIAYTVMYLVSGLLADRWGTRLSLAVFVSWWSAANILHMFARSAAHLAGFRFLLGLGEAGNYTAAAKAISEWYPPRERAFVNGLINAGSALGAIVAAPVAVWLTLRFGWRVCFAVTGALGLVWLVFWLALYRLPAEHRRITAAELAYIRNSPGELDHAPPAPWLGLWKRRDVRGLFLARLSSDPLWWFYLFWMPKYLSEQRGFTLAQIGLFAWLPYLTSDIGSLAGGYLSGRLLDGRRTPLEARYAVMLPAALFMPAGAAIPFLPSSQAALALICLVTLAHQVWKTNLMTITNDIFPVASVGSVSGIVALGSGIGGAVFMNLTGHIVQALSYTSIFLVMGFLHPAAYLVCRLLVPPARKRMDRVQNSARC